MQADPIGLNGGLNRYGYVGQSPLMYTDPFGLLGGDTVTAYCRQYPVDCIEIFYGPLPDDGCSPVLSAVSEALDNPVIAAAVSIASSKGKGITKAKPKKPKNSSPTKGEDFDRFSADREPRSIQDQMVLDAAKKGYGKQIMKDKELGDSRYKGMQKMEYKEKSQQDINSVVHYVKDPKTGNLMDFKFKR
jgi:uncharacterized protein RhaS with RHS repeats